MTWIAPGTFVMGSLDTEVDRYSNEGPQTTVTLTRGFYMSKYEVTQGEYLALMGTNPSYFTAVNGYGDDLSRPVETVSWNDAVAYCAVLTIQERQAGRIPASYQYRLPTEAEWEHACRAGTTTRFSFGDDLGYEALADYAWYGTNSWSTTHPVGQKLHNPWGLDEMHGNVCEWCQDWWSESLPGGIAIDPQGPATGSARVIRGGSWGPLGHLVHSQVLPVSVPRHPRPGQQGHQHRLPRGPRPRSAVSWNGQAELSGAGWRREGRPEPYLRRGSGAGTRVERSSGTGSARSGDL